MNNLIELIRRYTIQHDQKIKKICEPLQHIGISTYAYYSIKHDGSFVILSNYPKQLEFFYGEKLYLTCPYLKHPRLYRSGVDLIPLTPHEEHLETSKRVYQIDHLLLMIQQVGGGMEGFFYTKENLGVEDARIFLPKLALLRRFNSYFKREARGLIEAAFADGYNLSKVRGRCFFERESHLPLSSDHDETERFLKQVCALSQQEESCLNLFQQGHSAQSTAALMGISQRTVEHYFENIKNKLGCATKGELLNW